MLPFGAFAMPTSKSAVSGIMYVHTPPALANKRGIPLFINIRAYV